MHAGSVRLAPLWHVLTLGRDAHGVHVALGRGVRGIKGRAQGEAAMRHASSVPQERSGVMFMTSFLGRVRGHRQDGVRPPRRVQP